MNLWHAWSADYAIRLGWTVVHSIWQGSFIAAILAAILSCLPRRSAQARYLASLIALAAILACAVMTFDIAASTPAERAFTSTTTPRPKYAKSVTLESPIHLPVASEAASKPRPFPELRAISSRAARSLMQALPAIAQLWAAGVLVLCCWNLGGWIAAQRLRVIGVRPADESIREMALMLAGGLGLRRPVRVLISSIVQIPMVIGWLRPVLLLPAALATGFTPNQIQCLLAHELAHIRRHDYPLNLLQVLAETLLFYHPAVWWISRQVRIERERCCDEIAASLIDNRCTYAESLAALAESPPSARVTLTALGLDGGELLRRVRSILRLEEPAPRRGARLAIAACLLVFAVTIRVSLVRAEPAVAVQSRGSATTQPAAAFRADCVLSMPVDGKRQVVASPTLNLDNGGETSFLFTGQPPIIIRQHSGPEEGFWTTLSIARQPDTMLRIVCRLARRGPDAKVVAADPQWVLLQYQLRGEQRRYKMAQDCAAHRADRGPYTQKEIAQVSPTFANYLLNEEASEKRYQDLLTTYGTNYPAVINARERLERWVQMAADFIRDFNQSFYIFDPGDGATRQVVSNDLAEWRAKIDKTKQSIDAEEKRIGVHRESVEIQTDQIVKSGEPIAVELEDGTRLVVSVLPISH